VFQIIGIDKEEFHLNYMEKCRNGYIWPAKKDQSWEHLESLGKILPTPTLDAGSSSNRLQLYKF